MNNHTTPTILTAGQVAADLYMRKGYDIYRISPEQQHCVGLVYVTSDVAVAIMQGQMWVVAWGLDGMVVAEYPKRTDLDLVILDLEFELSVDKEL